MRRQGKTRKRLPLGLLLALAFPVSAADVQVQTGAGGEATWEVRLDAGRTWSQPANASGRHELVTTLEPVGKGAKASGSGTYSIDLAEEPADSRRSSILIRSVFPGDGKLRYEDPRVVIVAEDGPEGSGFVLDDNSPPGAFQVTPGGVIYRSQWRRRQQGDREVVELTLWFDPQRLELAGAREYRVEVKVRDRLEHETGGSFDYRYRPAGAPPSTATPLPADGNLLRCRYTMAVVPRVRQGATEKAYLGQAALIPGLSVAHLSLDLPYLPEAAWGAVFDRLEVTAEGPLQVSPVAAGAGERGYRVEGLAGAATAVSEGKVLLSLPRSVEITFRIPRRNGDPSVCPETASRWEVQSTGGTPALTWSGFPMPPGTSVETVVPAGDRTTLPYRFLVVRRMGLPRGSFRYDAARRTLDYLVQPEEGAALRVTDSGAELKGADALERSAALTATTDGDYRFRFPEVTEGWHDLEAEVALMGFHVDPRTGVASDTVTLTQRTLVKGPPPVIRSLRYDYQRQELELRVTDEGTPPEELRVELFVEDMALPLRLDGEGRVRIPLPQQAEKFRVLVTATDLAGQGVTRELTIYGADVYTADSGPLQIEERRSRRSHVPFGVQVLGDIEEGRQAYRELCVVGQRCLARGGQAGRTMTTIQRSGRGSGTGDVGITEAFKDELKEKYSGLPRRARDRMAAWELANILTNGALSRADGKPAHEPETTASPGTPALPPTFMGDERYCHNIYRPCGPVKYMDMTPPQIHDFVLIPDRGLASARISDPGTPLDRLSIEATDAGLNKLSVRSFDTASGDLSIAVPVAPDQEIVSVHLRVRDPERNQATASLRALTPKAPAIHLRTWPAPDPQQTVGLFAEMWDATGIDRPLTRLYLDGRPCAAVYLHGGFRDREHGIGERGTWYCRVRAGEGEHRFSATATDTLGASATVSTRFGQAYPPVIEQFRLVGSDPGAAGITVMGARITDPSGDLDPAGIELAIDGVPVPRERLYFDSASGDFAADGPLALERGFHRALLAATDRSGNRTEATLEFAYAGRGLAGAVSGDLVLSQIAVFELQGGNGDGLPNPGELVRLFITLANNGNADLEELEVRVTISDPGVRLERETFTLPRLAAGGTASDRDGIDVRLAPDLLSREGLELKELPVLLEVADRQGGRWTLQGLLTVYQQRAAFTAGHTGPLPAVEILEPADGRRLDFGTLSPAVAQVTVRGTFSTGDAPLERLLLRVEDDGGALLFGGSPSIIGPGLYQAQVSVPAASAGPVHLAAVITTTDGDRAEATGTVEVALQAAVNLPPSVTITSPFDGQTFTTGGAATTTVSILGTFDTADSPLDRIEVTLGGGSTAAVNATVLAPGLWRADFTLPVGNYTVQATIFTQDGDSAVDPGGGAPLPGAPGGGPIGFSVLPF